MAIMIVRSKALLAASKKLKFKSDKAIEKTAEFAGMGAADAYRCGAEEAQSEIVHRLAALTGYSHSAAPSKRSAPAVKPAQRCSMVEQTSPEDDRKLAEWHQRNFRKGNGCCSRCGTKLVTQSSGSVNGGYVKRCPRGCHDWPASNKPNDGGAEHG